MWQKSRSFVTEAGKVILIVSVVLWFLASYGPKPNQTFSIQESVQLEESYAGHFGKAIEPTIKPIGFNWKIGISLITSFAAREVFIGTISTIYAIESDKNELIVDRLRNARREDGTPVYTKATIISLLLFYAFALQCMSTIAVVYRETKGWKWPIIQVVYMTAVAYLSALATYIIFS